MTTTQSKQNLTFEQFLEYDFEEQGRHPDVSVVDKTLWDSNPAAYTAFREPLQLAVEVVSTNWEDDYIDKLDEYQRLGISDMAECP